MPALLQPPSVGLSASSRESLQHVFERMDKVSLRHHNFAGCKRLKTVFHPQRKTGRISYADFKDYAGSSGVQTLSEGELKSIFGDFSKTEVTGSHKLNVPAIKAPALACQTCCKSQASQALMSLTGLSGCHKPCITGLPVFLLH